MGHDSFNGGCIQQSPCLIVCIYEIQVITNACGKLQQHAVEQKRNAVCMDRRLGCPYSCLQVVAVTYTVAGRCRLHGQHLMSFVSMLGCIGQFSSHLYQCLQVVATTCIEAEDEFCLHGQKLRMPMWFADSCNNMHWSRKMPVARTAIQLTLYPCLQVVAWTHLQVTSFYDYR